MAKAAEKYDVWFVTADQVYRSVPFSIVTGWAEQGRLATDDRVRVAGSQTAWQRIGDHPVIRDFLFQFTKPKTERAEDISEQMQPVELDVPTRSRRRQDSDDEVDMIPLIDISLVLLVFFMMTTVVSALSPIEIPESKYAEEFTKEVDSFTVQIDKRGPDDVVYTLRVGDKTALEDNNLATLGELLARIDARLSGVQQPPEVRIAFHKDLPFELFRELTKELDKRQRKNLIRVYSADVNEAKK